jgi:hypothetical protein
MRKEFSVPSICPKEDFSVHQKLVVGPIRTIGDFYFAEGSGTEMEMIVRLGKSLQFFYQNVPALGVQPHFEFALGI